jgi:hypothetical protein
MLCGTILDGGEVGSEDTDMSRSDDLRSSIGPLWDKTVYHPFVTELGDGTLPANVFRTYFEQFTWHTCVG